MRGYPLAPFGMASYAPSNPVAQSTPYTPSTYMAAAAASGIGSSPFTGTTPTSTAQQQTAAQPFGQLTLN